MPDELTGGSYSGTLTVAGTTTSPATNVTVNTSNSFLYADATFASTNQPIANGSPREMRGREGINHVAAIVPFGFHAAICGLSHGEINTFTAIAKDTYGRRATNTITAWLPSSPSYSYDANGNLLSDGTRNFAYDDENQLITVWVTNVWQSAFSCDGKMRRRIRREFTWSSGAWLQTNEVHYIYDGNLPIQERDINNLPADTYTRGTDLSGTLQGAGGIGGLLARTVDSALLDPSLASSANAFYHADGNGNITALINAGQSLVAKYFYDPFGSILGESGPLADANLYRFSSKEFHPNSGLIYYLYRFYSPSSQRWNNRDPVEELGGFNLYTFVADDSINSYDSVGLCNIKIRCGPVKRCGITLGTHCGVIGPDGSEYGLTGGNGSSGSSGTAGPYHLQPSGPNSDQTEYPVSCPGKSCDDVQKSLQNYNNTVVPPPYNALGPNSDTYAHNMLNAAGCNVDPISRPPINRPLKQGGPIVRPPTTTPPHTIAW